MNPRSRWLAILALVAIFLAGGVTGWLVRPPGRGPHGSPHGPDVATHMRDRLTRDLSLTPEQVAKATPIIAEAAAELEKSRRDVEERVGRAFDEMNRKLNEFLTPEQQAKLKDLRERRRAMRDRDRPPR